VKRDIIVIDEELCTGCGECIPNCPEGALQIIDDKCRLVSDLLCDGLGACVGHCPEGAMRVEKREAEPYDEKKVMTEQIIPQGPNLIRAHLEHLREHGQTTFLEQALGALKERGLENPLERQQPGEVACGCPGVQARAFSPAGQAVRDDSGASRPSQLGHWPIQLHLVSPLAPFFKGKDVLLAADCTAFAAGDFHRDYLAGKSLIIACPKLDSNKEIYIDKLTALFDQAGINTLTVLIMEVPCCSGLLMLAKKAAEQAERKVPIKKIVLGIKGELLEETWV
jgi:ferredoxin